MKVHTTSSGTLHHRTRLMDQDAAERWSKAIAANSRFTAAEVVESTRAKSEERYFVSYAPASEAARLRLLDEQRAEREARARAEEFAFTWNAELGCYSCLSAKSGRTYEVSVSSCDCLDWLNRGQAIGCPCKHQISLLSQLEDGLVGEEEALERCEACGQPTAERVTVHAEDGPGSIPICEACEQAQERDAREAMLPSKTPILDARRAEAEARRKFDQDRFAEIFSSKYDDWLK